MLGFTVNRRPIGLKDTARNIAEDGQYVVNIATERMLEDLHASSEWLPADRSETEARGLRTAPSSFVGVPRLAEAPISMECVHERTIQFSPTGGDFVVGRVVAWHIEDAVMNGRRIDTTKLKPLGRLAGPRYTGLGHITELPPLPGG
jgi:flavin reductase (DIM6/NTAB) family NADH-FMN oxidoreductase RutF